MLANFSPEIAQLSLKLLKKLRTPRLMADLGHTGVAGKNPLLIDIFGKEMQEHDTKFVSFMSKVNG